MDKECFDVDKERVDVNKECFDVDKEVLGVL